MFYKRIMLLLLISFMMVNCKSIGSNSVTKDKPDYTNAIAESIKSQMLMNIVKIRYGDMPLFLDVSSVIQSYSLETTINGETGIAFGAPGGGQTLGIEGTYADKPTISYSPLVGDAYADSLMKPLRPEVVMQLIQSGFQAEILFPLCVEAINGMKNRGARGPNVRKADSDFNKLVHIMAVAQDEGILDFQVKSQFTDIRIFLSNDPDEENGTSISQFKKILNLNPLSSSYKLIYGFQSSGQEEVAMLTRSMLNIMANLSAEVQVPAEDIRDGKTGPGFPESIPRLIDIYSGDKPPEETYAAIQYEGHWFWIDSRDYLSKIYFSQVLTLFNLASADDGQLAPVLTIPAN